MENVIRHVFDGFALQRFDGDESQLCAGGLLHPACIRVDFSAALRVHDARKIADIALRLQCFPVNGLSERRQAQQESGHSKGAVHLRAGTRIAAG